MKRDEKEYHLLVIEDNLGDFVILEEYLSEYLINSSMVHAEDFKAATTVLNQSTRRFDLVFLDLSLPDKSGEDLVKEIIRLTEGIPVVVLTGFTDLEFGSRSLALGASDYLVKDDLSPAILYKSLIYNIQRVNFIQELTETKRKYADLFQLNPSPILVYDLNTLNILDVNNAACESYGYSREEFLTLGLKDIRPQEEIPVLVQSVEDFWINNKSDYVRFTRHLKKNGEIIDVEISPAKVKINNQNAAIVLIKDITENLKYIHKIEEQNQTFKEIAWIQSHVVRAPLARMMGVIHLLESCESTMDPETLELIQYIKRSSEELDGIVRDISKKSERVLNGKNPNDS
ncbi:response regulator [Algoriphagus confluentis]|uniref:histidine kinase n=1 Tax=Algoriphagus confluentis TaxID=1697556 RepID=A0ABQ6PPQ6_9BACT|nr:hypothetical protein Aconfl_22990 [Algoriphagus confluentis]